MRAAFVFKSLLAITCISTTGCFKKIDPPDSAAANQTTDEDEYGRGPSDPMYGFVGIPEPFGDESSLDYRITQQDGAPGNPIQIEVHTGSSYGPITNVEIMVRTTSGSQLAEYGYIKDPETGNEWTTLHPEGIYVQVYEEDDMKEIRYEPDDDGYRKHTLDDSGHARFVTSVTPTEAEPNIELRWRIKGKKPSPYPSDMALQIHPETM